MAGEEYALKWLRDRGYQPHQAAAIVGHGVQESGMSPSGVTGDGGTAIGAFQWRGPRALALQHYAVDTGQDWKKIDTQLGFLDHELNTTEKRAGDALRSSVDVRGATRAMMDFERPRGYSAANPEAGDGWNNRLSHAYRLAGTGEAPAPGIGDTVPQTAPAPAAMQAPGPTAGSIAMQFMQQTEADAKQKAAQATAEAARRRALFGGAPAAPTGLAGLYG